MSSRTGLAAVTVTALLLAPLGIVRLASGPSQAGGAAPAASAGNAETLPVIEPRPLRRVGAREIAGSRNAYAGVGPARAAQLARRSFPTWLAGPPQGRPKLSRGTRITSYVGDRAARIDSGKHRGLLVSTLPLRVRTRAGLKPIDLGLRRVRGALAPRRPLVPTRLPARVGAGVAFADLARITPATAAGRGAVAARRLGTARAIYPSIAADTDFIAEPTVLGVEAYWQLRSPQSPELQILRHSLGRGVTLRAAGEGVELVRDGRPVGRILAPQALDAAGRPVRVTQKLVGSELQLAVAHLAAGVRYPVLVDPGYVHSGDGYVTDNWYDSPTWRHGNPNGLQAWSAYSNHPVIYTANECDPTALQSNCDDGNTLGLFISAHTGWFTSGSGAFWQYQAQGHGESSWISYLQGAYVRVSSNGGPATTSGSMYIANNSGAPIYSYGFGSNWGPGNPAVSDSGASGHGRLARFQLTMSGDGQRNTYNTMSVGGAVIEMFEASAPALSGSPQLSWTPGEWYTGAQPVTAKPTFLNTGFGVARNEWITYKPGDWVPQSRKVRDQALTIPQAGCDGTHLRRCNYSWQTDTAIPTEQMPEGVNTVQLVGWSPSGKGSDAWGNAYSYKVDRSAPSSISFGGTLAGRDGGMAPAGSYTFSATGVDCSASSAVSQRSGVQKVAIQLDANPEESFGPGAREVCSYTTPERTWNLAPGEHVVRVTVTDWMGLVSAKTLTVTVVAAPQNLTPPTIVGLAEVGQTLTTTDGAWNGVPPITYTYAWQRCDASGTPSGCATISGATTNAYTVVAADKGRTLRAVVTATNLGGSSAAPSAVTNAIPDDAPGGGDSSYVDPTRADSGETPVADDGSSFPTDFCHLDSEVPEDDCSSDIQASAVSAAVNREPPLSENRAVPLLTEPTLSSADGPTDPASNPTALNWGISDQAIQRFTNPGSLARSHEASQRFYALQAFRFRLIVPYDVVTRGTAGDATQLEKDTLAQVRDWLIEAKSNSFEPVISFEHSRGVDCTVPKGATPPPPGETATCNRPNPDEYDAAVLAFRTHFDPRKDNPAAPALSRYPVVRLFTAWNEPNHSSQPTSNDGDLRITGTTNGRGARMAGKYWRKLLLQCRAENEADPNYGCAVAAGDFIDAPNADTQYLSDYIGTATTPGSGRRPHLWAWHAYFAGRPGTPGDEAEARLRRFLTRTASGSDYAADGPRVWLTEQGGQINNGSAFINDEPGAAEDIWRLTPLVSRYPRITRFYYYQLMKNPTSNFDSGLFAPGYGTRPNMYCAYARVASPGNRFCTP